MGSCSVQLFSKHCVRLKSSLQNCDSTTIPSIQQIQHCIKLRVVVVVVGEGGGTTDSHEYAQCTNSLIHPFVRLGWGIVSNFHLGQSRTWSTDQIYQQRSIRFEWLYSSKISPPKMWLKALQWPRTAFKVLMWPPPPHTHTHTQAIKNIHLHYEFTEKMSKTQVMSCHARRDTILRLESHQSSTEPVARFALRCLGDCFGDLDFGERSANRRWNSAQFRAICHSICLGIPGWANKFNHGL